MSIKKYLSVALLAGMSWGAQAQTAVQGNAQLVHLSLSQAVDIALLHNLTVKSYEVSLKNAELSYQQAWMKFRTWEKRLRFTPLRWLIPG
jgi:hypothetical protein